RFGVELLRDDTATHIAGIRINSFTSTFVFIGAVVYLILAPKGREDPATLSGSAAELLEPDSIDEAADNETPDTTQAPKAIPPVVAADEVATKAAPVAADESDVDVQAVAAEDDAPEVEGEATPDVDDAAAPDTEDTEAAEAEPD